MTTGGFRLGLTGFPLSHSLSPHIHGAALQALGLLGEYRLYPVPPAPGGMAALRDLVERVRSGDLTGFNITIPHKQNVLELLDDLTPAARRIGAVNTVFAAGGQVTGENTDAGGFAQDLQRLFGDAVPPAQAALVLGAGGSARAVVYALQMAGYEIALAARRPEQAQRLATELGVDAATGSLDGMGIEALLDRCSRPVGLVVNTTPLGMWPEVQYTPWPAEVTLPVGARVYDLVYNPGETRLVREARNLGRPAATGLGMLVEQAALAFETWTGKPAPREEMHRAAQHGLEAKRKQDAQ